MCPSRTEGEAECSDAPFPFTEIAMDPESGMLILVISETPKTSVTFPPFETRFSMDTIMFELIWDLADLQNTEESDFQRFVSHDENCTRNFGVKETVPRDFPNI
jgi:hypothetical protein